MGCLWFPVHICIECCLEPVKVKKTAGLTFKKEGYFTADIEMVALTGALKHPARKILHAFMSDRYLKRLRCQGPFSFGSLHK